MKKTCFLFSCLALASLETSWGVARLPQLNPTNLITSAAQTAPDTQVSRIWVSPDGDDAAQGTQEAPFASLQKALEHVRQLRATADESTFGEIHIILKGGIYRLSKTLVLTPEDSGTPSSPTIIEAAEGENPILSGGIRVCNWTTAGAVEGPEPEPDHRRNRVEPREHRKRHVSGERKYRFPPRVPRNAS